MILEPPKIKSLTVSTVSSSICHEVMRPDTMILIFWMLSFKPSFFTLLFHFIQRLFSSSSLSAIRLVSSAYLGEAMAPHSITLAWEIPWTEEPGRMQSWGHEESDTTSLSLSLFTFMLWRRKWQPTPVFLPGESQGQRSLVGFHLWGRTESDTTDATYQQQQQQQHI